MDPVSTITIEEFPILARRIVESGGAGLEVPVPILEMARYVRDLRREYYDLAIRAAPAENYQKPKWSLCYSEALTKFVDIIEREPRKSAVAMNDMRLNQDHDVARPTRDVSPSPGEKSEITSVKYVAAGGTMAQKARVKSSALDLDTNIDAYYFHFFCLFKEIDGIHSVVSQVWTRHS